MPWILPTSRQKLALANALLIIPMMISPGAMKLANGTPSTSRPAPLRPPPSATVKIIRYSSVVIAGAQIVWVWTLKNRRTSFI